MKRQTFSRALLGTTSVLALSAVAIVSGAAPAQAQIVKGVYGGGSSLASLSMRQLFDCYMGKTVGGDGYSFSTSFDQNAPTPGLLPNTCRAGSHRVSVEGMYASIGSGNGRRGFISNNALNLLAGSGAVTSTPAVIPPFFDNTNANFGTYPYPRIDFAASDAPLANPGAGANGLTTVSFNNFVPANNWQTTQTVTHGTFGTVTYSTATYGQPIQVPLFEVPVAIGVNTVNPTTTSAVWDINSNNTTDPISAGAAIQLSTAQVCAIFSGLVKDWSSTADIAFLDKNGTVQSQKFYADNTGNGQTAAPYASASLPIHVVFRSDGSGTTFIFTQYLKSVCPQLDDGVNNYASIFNAVSGTTPILPTDTFTNFRTVVSNVRGAPAVADWIGADGTGSVAINIGRDSANAGNIGYISNDFASPYATTVTGILAGTSSPTTAASPLSASVQDEDLRVRGIYHPTATVSFVAPTPSGADKAWQSVDTPAAGGTYQDWNVYNQKYTSGDTSGGVNLNGIAKLGLPTARSAYPIVGTAFLLTYSCYADVDQDGDLTPDRVSSIKNWMAWHFGGSDNTLPAYTSANSFTNPGYDINVFKTVRNNGFHELRKEMGQRIMNEFVKNGSGRAIAAVGGGEGCTGVAGGAAN